MSAVALAAGAAALAVVLLVRAPRSSLPGAGVASLRRWTVPVVLGAAVAAAVVAPRAGALLLVLAAAGSAGAALVRRQRARKAAELVSARVLETCELMASELAAGQAPGECLDRAAVAWTALAPVAAAFRVGADVPAAMRGLAADLDGAADLRIVAAAWQVAHRTGQGLAATIDRVAESLRAAAGTRRLVAGELASARATARLVAGLPVLALVMGSGAGGDPWGFLLGTPAGLACLALGLTFGLAGLWWIETIARGAEESA
ncbi:type II secretion system protein [Nocardioides conyzicola]|uniref:Type II secretion system protein n=1 Tax=Nocardioides conyzicola TaxID=1651781 RepID=A0ABP8X7M2_9ACTN